MLSLSIRPARRTDCDAVQKLINSQQDVLQKRFAQTNANSLLESSIINIVAVDDSDKVVGYAALSDCPPLLNHLAVLGPQRWEPWMAERFEQHAASAANSLWLTFFVSHAMFEAEVADMVLRFIYTSPTCSHVDSILAVLPVTAIAYCPLHERFNPLPTRPERASPTGSGAASSLAVYACTRSQVVPIVKVRRARVEDHDDLVPLFERQTQVLTQQYGQFFLVDLIGKQDSLNCALVAESNGRAVGLMVVTADADTAVLKQSFDLAAFNNLERDGPEDEQLGGNAFCITMFCMDERFEAQSGKLLALAFEQFPGREYCLLTMPHSCAETHLVSAYFSLVPSLPTTSFTHVLYLLHRESLEAASRVSSCASVLPSIPSLSADTIRAVRAGPEDTAQVEDLLVGMEGRDALLAEINMGASGQASAEEDEMQTWLFVARGHVIGAAVVKNEIRTKEMSAIQKQFHLDELVDSAAIPLFAHTELRLFVLHPVFLAHSRALLQTLLRVNGKTLMFHRASSSLSSTTALPVQPLLLKEMVQVKPRVDSVSRHVVSVGLQALHAAGSSLTENRSLFSLFVLGKAHLPFRKQVNNCRITVVGASDTGLSFLSGLLTRPTHYFSNVTLISRGGWDKIRELEGMRKHETLPRVSLSNSLCFEEGELERLGLEHRVRILDATVTAFDSESKTVDLAVALPPRPSSVAASAGHSQSTHSHLDTFRSAAPQQEAPQPAQPAQPAIPEEPAAEAAGPSSETEAVQPTADEPVFTIAIQQPDSPPDPAAPAPSSEESPLQQDAAAPAPAEAAPETSRTAVTIASTVAGQVGEPRGELFVKLSLAYDYLVLTPGLQDRALIECGFKPLSDTAAAIVNPSEPALSTSSSHQSLSSVLKHSRSVQEDLMGQNALDGGHGDDSEKNESPLPKYRRLDGVYSLREDIIRLTEYLAYVREVRYYTARSTTTAALPAMAGLPSDRRGTNTSQVSFDGSMPSPADLSARALFPRVIVYGASMDVVCAIESLIREGIPAKSITWAVPPRDRAIADADSSSSGPSFPSALDPRASGSLERQFSVISAANAIEELARVAENMTGQTVVVSKEAARRNSAVFKQGLHAYELTASGSAESAQQSAQLAAALENLDWCYGYEMVFQRTVAHLLKLGVTRLPNATLHSVEYDLPAPSSLPSELLRHAKRPVVKYVNLDVQIASGKGLGATAAALSPTESPVSSPIMVDTQRLPCDLLLTADRTGLDDRLFGAITRNELVFDGRLVVDAGFHTLQSSAPSAPRPAYPSASPVDPEPAIVYAAGSAAKFSRRRELFESEGALDPRALAVRGADMADLNARAVGEALCVSVLRDLGIHSALSSPLTAVARQCKLQLGSLPGGGFLELSMPASWRGLPSQVVSSDTNGLFCQLIFDQHGSLSSLIVHGPATRLPSNPRQLGNVLGLPMSYFHPLLCAMQDPRPQGVDLIAYLQSDSVKPLLSGEFGTFRGQLQSLLRSHIEEGRPLNTAEFCDAIPFSIQIQPEEARGASGLEAVTPVLRALLAKTKDIDGSAVSAAIQTLAKHLGPAIAKPSSLAERFVAKAKQEQL